jgi:hypothetical protein
MATPKIAPQLPTAEEIRELLHILPDPFAYVTPAWKWREAKSFGAEALEAVSYTRPPI